MYKQFVPYKLSLKLKELGFDEPCLAMYSDGQLDMWLQDQYDFRSIGEEDGFQFKNSMWNDCRFVAALLWQQAFDFIREKYSYEVSIRKIIDEDRYMTSIYMLQVEDILEQVDCITYQETRLACLEKLIEIIRI